MSFFRQARHRISSASKKQFVANLVNVAARCYQYWFAIYFAAAKFLNWTVAPRSFGWFIAALVYSNLHTLLPSSLFENPKWVKEEVKRAKGLAVAVSILSRCVDPARLTELEKHTYVQGILVAMRSEVEKLIVDTEGIYINVNLLVVDPADESRLLVLNRANLDRALNVSYKKASMAAWIAMSQKHIECIGDYTDPEKPYKSILAIPILEEKGRTIRALGATSIDSARKHEFDDLEKEIEAKLLPYLALIRLMLAHHNGGEHAGHA